MLRASGSLMLMCFALAACGGEDKSETAEGGGESSTKASEGTTTAGGDKTFEADDFSFMYPGEWDEQDPDRGTETGPITSSVFVGLNTTDLLGVNQGSLPDSISVEAFEAETTFAAVQLFFENQGALNAGPIPITIGGLPGFRYEGQLLNVEGVPVQSRLAWVFDDKTQYFLNCQYTPEHAEEMKRGCNQVVESFQVE